jgi:two-component sensor histidine kinase
MIAICCAPGSDAQQIAATEARQLVTIIKKNTADTVQANALLRLAEYHIFKPGIEKTDMDSAKMLVQQAVVISEKLLYNKGIAHGNLLFSSFYREMGETEKGIAFANKAVDQCKKFSEYNLLGESYRELSQYYSPWDYSEGFIKVRDLYTLAHIAFKNAGNIKEQAFCLKNLADLECNINEDPAQALQLLHQALELYKSIDFPQLQGVYDLFGLVYANSSDYISAVKYGLLAIQTAERVGDSTLQLSTIYNRMGRAYYFLKDYHSAKTYFLNAWKIADRIGSPEYVYDITPNVVNAYFKLNELQAALEFLNNLVKKYPVKDERIVNDATIYSLYTALYTRMKKFDKAREYCNKILLTSGPGFKNISNYYDLNRIVPYFLATKQYKMAETCLEEFNRRAIETGAYYDLGSNYALWFKLDSIRGNYLSAISYYQKFKNYEDSIFRADKSKLMAITRVEYETAKKDQDIQIKTQSIELLTKTNEVQKHSIEKSSLMQNMTLTGVALLLIVFGLLYNQYRVKKRSNKEISKKNYALQALVNEKELLLKEVHHRVKNNLHIVMSLLESQSAYLKNDALLAIQNSQNRVYTMSLIHQKLYQSETVSDIDMSVYLPELIHHLKDSFGLDHRIHFHTDIHPIRLDISQAIPVGLIINEAITNSIKYAFPDQRNGKVSIQMIRDKDNRIVLSIADDGMGLPDDFDYTRFNTLGMKLMKGLSEEIHARFKLENNNGTKIIVAFDEAIFQSETSPSKNYILKEA